MSCFTKDTSWKSPMTSARGDEGVTFYNLSFLFCFLVLCLNCSTQKAERKFAFFIYLFLSLMLSLVDSSRVYTPPDPPGYFDGYVWPMYLKNRQEMESTVSGISECRDEMCVRFC